METYVTLGMGYGSGSDEELRKEVEKTGAKLVLSHMLLGQYDWLAVFEAPDAHTASMAVYMAKRYLGITDKQSITMRAFTDDEMEALIAR